MKQLIQFNHIIHKLAPKFTVSDFAPSSYTDLKIPAGLVVWSGGSENTIYGDKSSNWFFRAWHDSLHIKHQFPFTLQGERDLARLQANQAERLGGKIFGEMIYVEIAGQAEYFSKHGEFPSQDFTWNELEKRGLIK